MRAFLLILTLAFISILSGMEFDLFVPGFSQIQTYFNLTPFWTEALLSINFLGYFFSLFATGYLADRFGNKKIIRYGLLLFILGSFFCLLGFSYAWLLLGRFLQGLGIAAPSILSFLIITEHYSLKKQQFFMAIFNAAFNIAVSVAPVIGSFIALYFHWRGNFTVLFVLGFLSLIMTLLFIPTIEIAKDSEKKETSYLSLFKSPSLLLFISCFAVTFIPYWIFVGLSPLLYVKNLHVHLSVFGYYQGLLAFSFAIGSLIFAWLMPLAQRKIWLALSLGLYAFALFFIAYVALFDASNPWKITESMLIFVLAQVIPGAILYPLGLAIVPNAKAKLSAVIQASRLLFAALSLQIAGYFYSGTFKQTGLIIVAFIILIILTQLLLMNNKELPADLKH